MNNCVIIIPVYKPVSYLSEAEKLSIRRTITVFPDYDIILIGPESINKNEYYVEFSKKLNFKLFLNFHFDNINSYSRLLMSSYFYSFFKEYDWMLICQTDVYVFRNDLIQFINQNDYFFIGAPVIDSQLKSWKDQTWVGNGGFSLRRIIVCIGVTKRLENIKKISYFLGKSKVIGETLLASFFRVIIGKVANINFNKFVTRYLNEQAVNEDEFWCLWVPSIFKKIRPADIATASKFSFERNPERLFNSIEMLPMGCHAWEKYSPHFWLKYIS